MTTLRQLANQASEALSHQTVSVQDLIDVAALLSLPLEGQDGNDSADAIAPTIEELIQIATVHGTGLKEAAAKYQAEPPAPRIPAKSPKKRSAKPKFKEEKSPTLPPAGQHNQGDQPDARKTGTHDAMIAGAMDALKRLQAYQKGQEIVMELASGRREPQNDVERMLQTKAQSILASTQDMSANYLSLEGGEINLQLQDEEISLDVAFETVANESIRLADYAAQPLLPSSY